jgi:hypothetical protein
MCRLRMYTCCRRACAPFHNQLLKRLGLHAVHGGACKARNEHCLSWARNLYACIQSRAAHLLCKGTGTFEPRAEPTQPYQKVGTLLGASAL